MTSESPSQPVTTGEWRYRLVRGEQAVPCRFKGEPKCHDASLYVENTSRETLECFAKMTFQGLDSEGRAAAEKPAVVRPGANRVVLKSVLPAEATVASHNVLCKPRRPLPPLVSAPECRLEVVRNVALEDYYPVISRRLSEEGPVVVQFALKDAEGKPTALRVVESSLFDRLDEAAVHALGDTVMKTQCPGTEYRLLLTFKLDE